MTLYQVVLIVATSPTAEQARALVGLTGGPIVERRPGEGTGRVVFHRDLPDVADAVVSAVRDVEAVGLLPVRLVNDDWVTMAGIAERLGRSRESIRLWSLGRVGPGGFPPPLNPGRDTSFYSWLEVTGWLRGRMGLDIPAPEAALVAAELAVRLRVMAPMVPRMDLIRGLFHA